MWVFGERFQRFSPDLLLAAQVLLPEEQETRGEERVIPQQSPIMAAIQGNETRTSVTVQCHVRGGRRGIEMWSTVWEVKRPQDSAFVFMISFLKMSKIVIICILLWYKRNKTLRDVLLQQTSGFVAYLLILEQPKV